MIVSKEFRIEDVTFTIEVDQDYSPVRGELESGDPDYADQEREEEDEIMAAIEEGNVWAWCIVTVNASWAGLSGKANIGGVSIILEDISDPEEYFKKGYGYYESLKDDALADLRSNMIKLGWSVND